MQQMMFLDLLDLEVMVVMVVMVLKDLLVLLLRVMSGDSEVGGNTSAADCEVSGDDAVVSLNARYLTDALAVMKTSTVMFATSGKDKACVLSPAGEEAADDYLHIIMPLRT
jgi:DNA polymerase III sliding clamp (beta) subunit (PCNA family)